MVKSLFASLLCCLALSAEATVYHSNGTASDIQSIHNSASNGDIITLPNGSFTWTSKVTISKAISLRGKGSGRILGETLSNVAIGMGTKTFVTTSTLSGITQGQILRIAKQPNEGFSPKLGRENFMEGTVTSYTGNTLVMNITSTGGSGTYTFWWIATKPKTTVTSNISCGGFPGCAMLELSESLNGAIDVRGIQFDAGNASGISAYTNVYIAPKALIHDCWFQTDGTYVGIHAATNSVVIYNNSFDDRFSKTSVGIQVKWEDDIGQISWRTPSSMGTADIQGKRNMYIEDNDFHGYLNSVDFDSNARAVFRHNVMDNSGFTSHGADTGPIGMRHVEIYDNVQIFNDLGDCDGSVTPGITWWFWIRGGTGVVTDNVLPQISSCAWNVKPSVRFTVLNIWRNEGCYPCWVGYPAPHQVGQGYGSGAILHQWSCPNLLLDADYYTYLEPVYIWNNTGTGATSIAIDNDNEGDTCGNGQDVSDYVKVNRDYYLGTAKPGWTKYIYPFPGRI